MDIGYSFMCVIIKRTLLGKNADPSVGIADSQSIKTTEKKGFAGMTEAKKLKVGKDTYWLITFDC